MISKYYPVSASLAVGDFLGRNLLVRHCRTKCCVCQLHASVAASDNFGWIMMDRALDRTGYISSLTRPSAASRARSFSEAATGQGICTISTWDQDHDADTATRLPKTLDTVRHSVVLSSDCVNYSASELNLQPPQLWILVKRRLFCRGTSGNCSPPASDRKSATNRQASKKHSE